MTHPGYNPPKPITSYTDPNLFQVRYISVLAYGQGFTLWHYKAPLLEPVLSPTFFSSVTDMFAPGDRMTVSNESGCLELLFMRDLTTRVLLSFSEKQND